MPTGDTNVCPFSSSLGASVWKKPRGRMYGLLFESIQYFIIQDYGQEVWEAVLLDAGLENAIFIGKKTYPDEWMVSLAKSTHKVLQVLSFNDVMFYFGTCFVIFCTRVSYDKILRNAGRTLRDFLYEIDNIHETIRFSHPKMQSPSFVVQSEDKDGCILVYQSMRTGFSHYVMGQLVQCAKQFYQVVLDVNIIEEKHLERGCNVTFRLSFDNHAFSSQSFSSPSTYIGTYPSVNSDTFFKLFPFSLVFNSKMKIVGCGDKLVDLLKGYRIQAQKTSITDLFNLRRPLVEFTWSNTLSHQRVIFEISLKKGDMREIENTLVASKESSTTIDRDKMINSEPKKLLLRGQMKYIEDWDAIAFLCTPCMSNIDDMQRAGMFLEDLNMFDNSRDLVLAGQQCASDIEYTMEKQVAWSRRIEDTLAKLRTARQQSDDLINSMLTKSVADRLKSGVDAVDTCETFSEVTVMFSNLVQFPDICTEGTPFQVVQCIQNATEVFDKIVDKHKLFKVETLGDGVYMVAGGVPDRCDDHAKRVAGFALELVENAKYAKNPITGEGMEVLIGIHTGGVVAGIVGKRTPQYCLFGDTVNTAARMQTNSLPDRILLTKPCRDCLKDSGFITAYRDKIPVKGKGEMKTYWLVGWADKPNTTITPHKSQRDHNNRLHLASNPALATHQISNTQIQTDPNKEVHTAIIHDITTENSVEDSVVDITHSHLTSKSKRNGLIDTEHSSSNSHIEDNG